MRPFEPGASAGTVTGGFAALTGLAALDTVGDFGVFLVEGKSKF
jgi:hypothetical protein